MNRFRSLGYETLCKINIYHLFFVMSVFLSSLTSQDLFNKRKELGRQRLFEALVRHCATKKRDRRDLDQEEDDDDDETTERKQQQVIENNITTLFVCDACGEADHPTFMDAIENNKFRHKTTPCPIVLGKVRRSKK